MTRSIAAHLFHREQMHPGALQRFNFRLRSHETWSQGFCQCLRATTPPTEEDHQAFKLPQWAASLYPFLRPWRLLREHGLGLRPRHEQNVAPFVPTPPEIVEQMVRLAGVHDGDVFYDLGCGQEVWRPRCGCRY